MLEKDYCGLRRTRSSIALANFSLKTFTAPSFVMLPTSTSRPANQSVPSYRPMLTLMLLSIGAMSVMATATDHQSGGVFVGLVIMAIGMAYRFCFRQNH
jgi:hypothetical protein